MYAYTYYYWNINLVSYYASDNKKASKVSKCICVEQF